MDAELMGVSWVTAGCMMLVHIAGSVAFGWTTNHVTWWVALAAMVLMFVVESYTYWIDAE